MATAAELIALADRCEREGTSWDLDRAIGIAALGWVVDRGMIFMPDGDSFVDSAGGLGDAPTEVVEDALKLKPDGWRWQGGEGHGSHLCWARAFPTNHMERGTGNREAQTVAMALCSALLRAHAALKNASSHG